MAVIFRRTELSLLFLLVPQLCDDVDEDYDHRAVCVGHVLACCVLGFDHVDTRVIDDYEEVTVQLSP